MNNLKYKKTVLASVVAGTFIATQISVSKADVLYASWSGAFTMLGSTGGPRLNTPSAYQFGYYAFGDGAADGVPPGYGAPKYPGNVGSGADCTSTAPVCYTSHGWNGLRTPVSGTLAFDITNSAGVGTVNPFFFFGNVPGSGVGTHVARTQITFQAIDTVGTLVSTMLFSWNGGGHSISIVLDGSGLFSSLGTTNNPGPAMIDFMTNGPTATISGIGALPATDGINFGSTTTPTYLPLGPSLIATKTTNALGCEAVPVATQVNAYTINTNFTNLGMCNLSTDDGIGGSPMLSSAFGDHNVNFDILSVQLEDFQPTCMSCIPEVPVPPAMWLFGSGLLGLLGVARRRKTA